MHSSSPSGEAVPIITIDGPGGSGKGTVSQCLACDLGWHFLDSGALYRVLALTARLANLSWSDGDGLAERAAVMNVQFVAGSPGDELQVLLNQQDVSAVIRTHQISDGASKVGAFQQVRDALVQRQRDFVQAPGLIADGRDMGTTIFPVAGLKIFLTASAEARAERRTKQLLNKGIHVTFAQILAEVATRDKRDSERAASPMQPADDAIVIDTTDCDVSTVFVRIRDLVRERFNL